MIMSFNDSYSYIYESCAQHSPGMSYPHRKYYCEYRHDEDLGAHDLRPDDFGTEVRMIKDSAHVQHEMRFTFSSVQVTELTLR